MPGAAAEFWNETATQASWERLQKLRGEFEFTLIGGWAVWLWTKQHKSKDIDIIVNFDTLLRLKAGYGLQKNDRLKKYEIKSGLFDIDVYVANYSELAMPPEEVARTSRQVDGFRVASPETLVILKQGAYEARKGTTKGRKDAIDLISLLMRAPFNAEAYGSLLKRHGLGRFEAQLAETVKQFDPADLKYLGANVHGFKRWKERFLKILE